MHPAQPVCGKESFMSYIISPPEETALQAHLHKLRTQLHEDPELSWQEHRTTRLVRPGAGGSLPRAGPARSADRHCRAPARRLPAPPSACAPIWTPCRSRSAPERNFPPAFPASCTPADMMSIWPPCSAQPACLQRGGSSWPGTSCSCSSPPRRPQRAPCRCWSRGCSAAFR